MGQTSAHYSTQLVILKTHLAKQNIAVRRTYILRLLLINEVAVHVLVSKTLDCDQPKCQLVILTIITDKMEF